MEHRVSPQDVVVRQKTMDLLSKAAKVLPTETFRLMEWVIIIAAVLVADERLNSSWLQWLAFALSMLLVMRVNSVLSEVLKHPEEVQPDGSLVVKFSWWKTLFGLSVAGFAYYLAFGVSALFAESDQAERTPTAHVTPAPRVTPQAAPQTPPKASPKAPQLEPAEKPQEAPATSTEGAVTRP